ncbi:MAG TPA: hypothetical protein DCY20_00390 [Firmicutes bacterium]|nr:hypothetical protein [Bacillota bacterium]
MHIKSSTLFRHMIQLLTIIFLLLACFCLLILLLPNTQNLSAAIINQIFTLPLLSNLFIATLSLLELYSITKLMTLLFGLILIFLASHFLLTIALEKIPPYKKLMYHGVLNVLLWGCLVIFIPATTYLGYLSSLFMQQAITIQHPNYLDVIDTILVNMSHPKIGATIAFSVMLEDIRQNPEYVAALDDSTIKPYTDTLNKLMSLKKGVLNKEEHYLRNVLNRAPATLDEMLTRLNEGWLLMSPVSAAYHMYGKDGEYNVKFVSTDGHFEAVYNKDGRLVTEEVDAINMATYNFASPYQDKSGHETYDITPYKTWGNTPTASSKSLVETTLNIAKFYGNNEAKARYDELQEVVFSHQKK